MRELAKVASAICNLAKHPKAVGRPNNIVDLKIKKMINVICLQDEAFYKLIEEVVGRVKDKNGIKSDRWISGEEAMKKLRIKSKTTLQHMRNTGVIRFSQPEKKIILYDTESIEAYLEKHTKETF